MLNISLGPIYTESFIYLFSVYVCYGVSVEVRGQLTEISSLPPLRVLRNSTQLSGLVTNALTLSYLIGPNILHHTPLCSDVLICIPVDTHIRLRGTGGSMPAILATFLVLVTP